MKRLLINIGKIAAGLLVAPFLFVMFGVYGVVLTYQQFSDDEDSDDK